MIKVDLNCDMGESFGNYTCGMDAEVVPHISSANVACGFHASDPLVMEKTVALCKENNVRVGAHPGFPDLVGFGRRQMQVSADELRTMVIYQVGALKTFCDAAGVKLQHVKPHGAMYNMAAKDIGLSLAIANAVRDYDRDLILLALSGSEMINAAKQVGIRYASEVFADRAYEADGTLRARTLEGSMITDENEAIERVIRMIKEGKVRAYSGEDVPLEAHSVCVHGDSAKALDFVKALRKAFSENGIETVKLSEAIK